MRRYILAFILLIGSTLSLSAPISPPAPGECRNYFGSPVRYIPLPSHAFDRLFPNYMFAAAISSNLIVYDLRELGSVSPELQELVYWHECAHHALGHTISSAYQSQSSRRHEEDQADCYAAKAAKKNRSFEPGNMRRATGSMLALGMDAKRIAITWKCATSP